MGNKPLRLCFACSRCCSDPLLLLWQATASSIKDGIGHSRRTIDIWRSRRTIDSSNPTWSVNVQLHGLESFHLDDHALLFQPHVERLGATFPTDARCLEATAEKNIRNASVRARTTHNTMSVAPEGDVQLTPVVYQHTVV